MANGNNGQHWTTTSMIRIKRINVNPGWIIHTFIFVEGYHILMGNQVAFGGYPTQPGVYWSGANIIGNDYSIVLNHHRKSSTNQLHLLVCHPKRTIPTMHFGDCDRHNRANAEHRRREQVLHSDGGKWLVLSCVAEAPGDFFMNVLAHCRRMNSGRGLMLPCDRKCNRHTSGPSFKPWHCLDCHFLSFLKRVAVDQVVLSNSTATGRNFPRVKACDINHARTDYKPLMDITPLS